MKAKPEASAEGHRSTRDPFSAAKDNLLLTVGGHPYADENALKVAVWLVKEHANRREFEASGRVVAWPSIRTLSVETGLTKARVQRGIDRLEMMGLMQVTRPEKRGAKHHNVYALSVEWLRDRTEIQRDIQRDIERARDDADRKKAAKNVLTNVDIPKRDNVRTGEDNENAPNVRTDDTLLSSPMGPNLLDYPPEHQLEGVGAPSGAPRTPTHGNALMDARLTEERVGSVAHERDNPPLPRPSEHSQEWEPDFDPIDRDLPEIPEDVAERFRQDDEAQPPPEPEPHDGPEPPDRDVSETDECRRSVAESDLIAAFSLIGLSRGFDAIEFGQAWIASFHEDSAEGDHLVEAIAPAIASAGRSASTTFWAMHIGALRELAMLSGDSEEAFELARSRYTSAVRIALKRNARTASQEAAYG